MKISYFKISGFDGLIRSFFMTNKNYTEEIEKRMQNAERFIAYADIAYPGYTILMSDCESITSAFIDFVSRTDNDINQMNINTSTLIDDIIWYRKMIRSAINCGNKHTTLLRFVDFTFVVDGLHRGGQDDFDSHAKRLESRIVRMTTRTLNNEKINDISDFYKGKIMTFTDLVNTFNLPEVTEFDDETFVRTPFGYVNEEYANDRDVLRGNVPLAVSSMFTVKVNMTEFCHIVRERAPGTAAAPELQEMIRMLVDDHIMPALGDDFDLKWFKDNCLQ